MLLYMIYDYVLHVLPDYASQSIRHSQTILRLLTEYMYPEVFQVFLQGLTRRSGKPGRHRRHCRIACLARVGRWMVRTMGGGERETESVCVQVDNEGDPDVRQDLLVVSGA